MVDEERPGVGMPRPRWDRERRVSRQSAEDAVIRSWITVLMAFVCKHWPWVTSAIATGLLALLYNVYVLGGMAQMVNSNIDRLARMSDEVTKINLHVVGLEVHHDDLTARVETLERSGSPVVQALRVQVESLAIGYHELYPMVSKDLHDLIARIEGLQEHSKGDVERFDGVNRRIGGVEDRSNVADNEIRTRMNLIQQRMELLSDRIGGTGTRPGAP
jgi:hypothetical protein